MKKSLLVLASLGAFAGIAHAQSSVTLYGLIDEGFNYTSNVKGNDAFQLESGDLQGSRWGLKGNEDLGNGLRAIFQLENGFNVNTGALGQGGLEFGRQAYVGLASNTAGALTLGRQYDSVVDDLAPLTANGNWAGELFSHPFDNDNTDNSFRINNSVKYTSVNYSGFQFTGLYGFSNTAGAFSDNSAWSLGATYANGPLSVAAAYLNLSHPGATCGGAVTGTVGDPNTCTGSEATFTAAKQQTGGLGASYVFGQATVSLTGSETYVTSPGSSLRFINVEGNVHYFVTPAVALGAMYVYTHVANNGSSFSSEARTGIFNTIGLMADYYLSKKTDVYVQAVADIGSQSEVGYVTVPGTTGDSSSRSQVVARIGIREKF